MSRAAFPYFPSRPMRAFLCLAGADFGERHQPDVVRVQRIDMRPPLAAGADERGTDRIALESLIAPIESRGGWQRHQGRQQLSAGQFQGVEEIVLACLALLFVENHNGSFLKT